MQNSKVKICGVRSIAAAQAAIVSGADFLGFNFVPGLSRTISVAHATNIASKIKGKILLVGIFQDAPLKEVVQIAKTVGLDFVQLHGNEDNEYIQRVPVCVIKSVFTEDKDYSFPSNVTHVLLDIKKGTKKTILDKNPMQSRLPAFIAGGLTIDNVGDAIKKFSPYGVDVARGIETDGKEDLEKIRLFIERVKSA